jgi:Xaa-Pro aminopeptidase
MYTQIGRLVARKTILFLLLSGICASAIERQSNADYRARRMALANAMHGGTLILFAATEPEGPNELYGFRQDDNFYYLTGWSEPGAALLISAASQDSANAPNPHGYAEILFLPAHNLTQEKWTGPKLGPEDPDAPRFTGFDKVEALDKMHDELLRLLPQGRVTVYSDLHGDGEISPSAVSLRWLRRTNSFPTFVSFTDVTPLIAKLRTVKDTGEHALIDHAVQASVAAHLAALKAIHPGTTEREISALMQYEFGKRGCERPAYAPIVGSGLYSTVLHYSEDSATMKDGDIVVMDVGGEYSMYASDITRTAPVNGKFTARQREIYDIVLGAQEAAIRAFQAGKSKLTGNSPDSLYKIAYDYINSHGKDQHGASLGKYFIHGLGHHVGLNVHDANAPGLPLDKGMIFTLEPGIYVPEEKLGVRIEDMFYVDLAGKLVMMTRGLPRTADEVEKAMAAR